MTRDLLPPRVERFQSRVNVRRGASDMLVRGRSIQCGNRALDRTNTSNDRDLAMRRRPRRCCPSVPGSNPCKTQDDRREAQKELLLAGRNPNKSQVYPVLEPNGSRTPPGRSSLPDGNSCNALGSNNHVPERTSDQQR